MTIYVCKWIYIPIVSERQFIMESYNEKVLSMNLLRSVNSLHSFLNLKTEMGNSPSAPFALFPLYTSLVINILLKIVNL